MAVISGDAFFSTIGELQRGLTAKEFSSVELAGAFCDRLERLGPRYNALSLLLRERALRQAAAADEDRNRGRRLSPIHGIPYAVKDLLALAGHPTTWGARPYASQVFDFDATVLKKLDKAGAILTGKLAMIELAGGGDYRFAAASVTGPCLNPWDTTRWAGGSSSGPGAAVGAGLAPFAIGSETSGSILCPSAYCGITGLRPTYGLVSRYGAMALAWTMDKLGPMCRSAEDCGLVLEAMAGADPNDAASAGKSFHFKPEFVRPFEEIHAGFAPVDFDEWAEPAVRSDLRKALDIVKGLSLKVSEVALPDLPYGPVTDTIISAEGSSIFEPLISSGRVDELADQKQIAGLKAGLAIPATDYLKAMRIRTLLQRAFHELFSGLDVLVTPSMFERATKITQPLDQPTSDRPDPKTRGLSDMIGAGNLAGLPALSLPCGFAEGMPVGLSLVGPPFSENVLLKIGIEFQKRTDWHRRRPPIPG